MAKVGEELLALGRTPQEFLDNSKTLQPLLATLGLRWRSDNLNSAATFVQERLDGDVPDNWQELVAIPGVGDYIASAVLCFAFGRRSVLMDTNTTRIARRLMGGPLDLGANGSTCTSWLDPRARPPNGIRHYWTSVR